MDKESDTPEPNRCRLVISTQASGKHSDDLLKAVAASDVASVILYCGDQAEHEFEASCKKLVGPLQQQGCAVLIADSTQVFGKSDADGLFLEKEKPNLDDILARFSPHNIVGCGNIKTRHNALVVGEAKPDFVFFGKLAGDIKPEAHPKNIALGEWWSELVEIPCIVMGGNHLDSVVEVAQSGVDFVALDQAIFTNGNAVENVVAVNQMLDEHAPSFEEEDE